MGGGYCLLVALCRLFAILAQFIEQNEDSLMFKKERENRQKRDKSEVISAVTSNGG
jgi:hypothetical protein